MTSARSNRRETGGSLGRRGLAGLAMLWAIAIVLAGPARSAPPEFLQRLQGEAITQFDFGMKSLRRLALDAARRFSSAAEPGPTVAVWYNSKTNEIEIRFQFVVPEGSSLLGRGACVERRRLLLLETFRIGRTLYEETISLEERIRRRLGLQFAHEPMGDMKEVNALGELLSKITFLEVRIVSEQTKKGRRCRGPVDVVQADTPP